jgi:alkylation response protein AidB-like acyl-CoA dehydrogenase
VALGIARAAIDLFLQVAASNRASRSLVVLAEREPVQEKAAQAEALVRSSRAFLYETIRETWWLLGAGIDVPEELTAINRLAAAAAVDYWIQPVDLVFTLGGTTSIYEVHQLERCFRDIHVVRQHAVVSPNATLAAGRYFLGLPPH